MDHVMDEGTLEGGPLERAEIKEKVHKDITLAVESLGVWRYCTILGEKLVDGINDIRCNHCNIHFFLNLHRSGTNTLLRHMRGCTKTLGSTPGSSARKLDIMLLHELIAMTIIKHDLPYSFVEYRRIRMSFTYANRSIWLWSRNTAAADVLKIFEKEKLKLKKILIDIPSKVCLAMDPR